MANEAMPFLGHLDELRRRIIASVVALLAGFLMSFYFSEYIFKLLTFPMKYNMAFMTSSPFIYFVLKEKAVNTLVFLAPAEAFWMHMKISLVSGLMITSPVIIYQVWGFISPGLSKKEKRFAAPFILVTTGLFLFGAVFCFAVVLPFAMGFLLTYKTASLTPMISVGNYVDFCLKFILAFGVVFELPVIIVVLTRMNIVSVKTLARHRKYAALMAFVVAAVLTPTPDAFNQTLMAVPIIFLYEAGLLLSRLVSGRSRDDG
jgi:sec-independent protein translocase protein TatC